MKMHNFNIEAKGETIGKKNVRYEEFAAQLE